MDSEWQHLDLYELIGAVAAAYKPKSYLEIGVDTGESVKALLAQHPRLKDLILCDTWSRQKEHTPSHVEQMLVDIRYKGEVTYLNGRSQDLVLPFLSERPVDMAFVDGDHTYEGAKTDIANVWPHTKIMLVHDIEFPDVWRAFYEFCCAEKPYSVMCAFAGHGAGLVMHD